MALVTQKVPQSRGDDNGMMKEIQATDAPDGQEVDVNPFLLIIEGIFKRAGFGIPGFVQGTQLQLESMEDKALSSSDICDMLDLLSHTISKISREISCKCSSGGDAHATTVAIFNVLSSYSWDAKLVLALAAFAVNYGEFCLVVQVYPTNPLAKSVAFLRQMPEIMERAESLKPKFEALNNLIKAMLDVTKCIVQFRELPSQYISPNTPAMLTAAAHIPTAVYWTIRSIVACASQIMGFIDMTQKYIAPTTEFWELSSLAQKVKKVHSHLLEQFILCQQIVTYLTLVDDIKTSHDDNMKILKDLLYAKENQLLLFDGSKDIEVRIEVLRGKNVLLFITDLEIPTEEFVVLIEMYNESRRNPLGPERQYEVVWLHVKDDSIEWDEKEKIFKDFRKKMPWYSLSHSELDPAVNRFIKDVWKFNKNPLLVLLDPQGKVVNPTQSI